MRRLEELYNAVPDPTETLHREAVVAAAEAHVIISPEGRPVRFSHEEAARLAFFVWRVEQAGLREPGAAADEDWA